MATFQKRGLFVALPLALLTLVLFLGLAKSPFGSRLEADLVLINGRVITVDSKDSIAEGVAIKNGKIVKVGSAEVVRAWIGPETQVMDLKGKTATPGLIDSHNHVMYFGRNLKHFVNIRPPMIRSKEGLLNLIREKAQAAPRGQWIAGNQGFALSRENTPHRGELDQVSPGNPVYLPHISGQYAIANSLALKLVGIDRDTPDPFRGIIEKDPKSGEPTGFLIHYPARELVARMAVGPLNTAQLMQESIEHAAQILMADGITSAQDVILYRWSHVWPYRILAQEKKLPLRMYLMVYVPSLAEAKGLALGSYSFDDGMVKFGGWKLAVDGGPVPGTVLMHDETLPASKNSYLFHTQEELNKIVALFDKAGYQLAFHAVGDKAMDMVLDAIELVRKETPRRDHRHRLEHAVFPSEKNLRRIRELEVIISTTPQWIYFAGRSWLSLVGEEIAQKAIPLKTMLRNGIPLAFGSDVPATYSHKPQFALWAAVARETFNGKVLAPEERITIQEALRIHTLGGAYASFEEKVKGSIEEGKLADLAVWSDDLYLIPQAQIKDLTVEVTIIGGKIVHLNKHTSVVLEKGETYLRQKR